MNLDLPTVLASLVLGALLGLGFYAGLRATLVGIGRSRRPVARILASLVLRFGVVLLVFFVLARIAGWPGLVAAAMGFMLVRPLVLFAADGRRRDGGRQA